MTTAGVGLLDWLEAARPDCGLHVAAEDGSWRLTSYAELAEQVIGAAATLRDAGVQPGQVITLILPQMVDFAAAFFAALWLGATPSVLAPPQIFDRLDDYRAAARRVLGVNRSAFVVIDPALRGLIAPIAGDLGLPAPVELAPPGATGCPRGPAPELALVQMTSGSTGPGRPVPISRGNLESNLAMIRTWLQMRPDDATASWLPVYHDMGLIGCFLSPICAQTRLWLMRPDQFITRPLRWLECFGARGATLTALPNFGLAYVARKVTPAQVADLDFTRWRVAIIGAERVDARILDQFVALVGPCGFARRAFMPAYGLAEATLAVTGCTLEQSPRVIKPDWSRLRVGEPLPIEAEGELGKIDASEPGWLVGCGRPHQGLAVEIRRFEGEDGGVLPAGSVGEIVLGGPTVARGYLDGEDPAQRFGPDGLRTGDAGFVHGGELYVLGRIGDSVKVRGRPVYMEDLESRLGPATGLKSGRFTVLAGLQQEVPEVVVVAELGEGDWVGQAERFLRRELGARVRIRVCVGGPGTILRTSSGKPRRRAMWASLVEASPSVRTLLASEASD